MKTKNNTIAKAQNKRYDEMASILTNIEYAKNKIFSYYRRYEELENRKNYGNMIANECKEYDEIMLQKDSFDKAIPDFFLVNVNLQDLSYSARRLLYLMSEPDQINETPEKCELAKKEKKYGTCDVLHVTDNLKDYLSKVFEKESYASKSYLKGGFINITVVSAWEVFISMLELTIKSLTVEDE